MLIGITGPAGVGKTTGADYLVSHHEFTRTRFAAPLKAMLDTLLIEVGVCNATDRLRMIEGDLKNTAVGALDLNTPRKAMQTLGTEWGRKCMGDDFWVNAMSMKLRGMDGNIVIDDVRFDNEADMIRMQGGVIVHMTGRGGIGKDHASEAGVTMETGDATLRNDGDIADLDVMFEKLVQALSD